MNRRRFLKTNLASIAALGAYPPAFSVCKAQTPTLVLGQGDFQYRVVAGWGNLGGETPVANCHGIVCTRDGHIILLTTHTANNVIVYDKAGRLVHKWGKNFPGAHGLSLVEDGGREVLFITDLNRHRVVKATLEGEILNEWQWPEASGKYTTEAEYRPSWTLHLTDGTFFVLDGYGRDYICRYGPDGKWREIFGGQEGGIQHWGPHGGMAEVWKNQQDTLLIAMSDQQHLLRLSLDGRHLETTPLPGGNPRQIRRFQNHYFVAHLADNWPKDRNSRGFISILDKELRVVSNVGGSAPSYSDEGHLQTMRNTDAVFTHPHDVSIDPEGSLYVAQFMSGNTYPVKLERI